MDEQLSKEVGVFLTKSEGEGDNVGRRTDLSFWSLGLRGRKTRHKQRHSEGTRKEVPQIASIFSER